MAKVVFKPKYTDAYATVCQKMVPICNRVCGTSKCLRALEKGGCPGYVTSGQLVCRTHRYIEEDEKTNLLQVAHAARDGGTVKEISQIIL